MSFILDALRKAERERVVGEVPRLDVTHGQGAEARLPSWIWVAAAAVVLLAVVAWVPWGTVWHASEAGRDLAVGGDESGPIVLSPQGAQVSRGDPRASARTMRESPQALAPPADIAQSSPVPVHRELSVRPLPSLVAAPRVATKRSSTHGSSAPAPTVPLSSPSELATEDASDAEHIPLLYELSSGYQGTVPKLHIDVHVYSASPGRSFVIVNGRTYRAGDSMDGGAVLEAVTADGIVVAFQDERFRLLY